MPLSARENINLLRAFLIGHQWECVSGFEGYLYTFTHCEIALVPPTLLLSSGKTATLTWKHGGHKLGPPHILQGTEFIV